MIIIVIGGFQFSIISLVNVWIVLSYVVSGDTLAYKHNVIKVVVPVDHSSALLDHYERNTGLTKTLE